MRLQVKDVDIATGNTLVAIMNELDAKRFDLHFEDRVKLKRYRKEVIVIIDISENSNFIPKGSIGLMEEVLSALNVKDGDNVRLEFEKTPKSVGFIKKKLDGNEISKNEIFEIVEDVVENRLSTIEMTYFVAGCYNHGLSLKESINLTKAMVETGDKFNINRKQIVDKHCIGGVPGNRTTMVVVPILAAGGLTVPKTSSRSITSPAGTADTMEVLSNVSLTVDKMTKVVEKTNACIIWGGAYNLAAADDKLIRLRHSLSLDPIGMVLASVLAKKLAVGATHVLIDIPYGKGAKVTDKKQANKYKDLFEKIGSKLGMKVRVLLTDGTHPIGNGIGAVLEARDVMWVLEQDKRAPCDLREKSLELAGEIFEMVGRAFKGQGKRLARFILNSGMAHNAMKEIIKAQGQKNPDLLAGKYSYHVKSKVNGKVKHIDNKIIAKIARVAGSPVDKAAGIYIHKHVGSWVRKDDPLYTIYANSKQKLNFAKEIAKNSGYFF
ncbi:MAG: AMP phosphorylase [Candidatus Woesearchaeota archaeon]|nr:AMP phosphorylase [Candidatus Woesearchaeota archaeon]